MVNTVQNSTVYTIQTSLFCPQAIPGIKPMSKHEITRSRDVLLHLFYACGWQQGFHLQQSKLPLLKHLTCGDYRSREKLNPEIGIAVQSRKSHWLRGYEGISSNMVTQPDGEKP
jgi:hypothetical protein